MGILERVQGFFRQSKEIDVEDVDVFDGIEQSELWEFVSSIQKLNHEREKKFADYEEMSEDSVIQSAMELIADDATQTDHERNRTIWVESVVKNDDDEDEGDENGEEESNEALNESNSMRNDLEVELNTWLHDYVGIEDKIWTYAYNVIKYGEIYLNTFFKDERFKKDDRVQLGDYFELVSDPLTVNEIIEYGETAGFFVSKGDKGELTPASSYIHFFSDRGYNREEIEVEIEGEEDVRKFTIRYGTSFLDAARQAYRVMKIINDVLLLTRISKSTLYRMFNVEVGQSGRKETVDIINSVKKVLNSEEFMNKSKGIYKEISSPIPLGGNVFIPTRSDKGNITVDEIGGEIDVGRIMDVEHFRNRLFAALKVPKPFLGVEESLPGTIGSTSLTKLDIRYARTVKRVQSVLESGVRKMCNFYLTVNDKKNMIDKFKVRMSEISTTEDEERTDTLDSRVRVAESVFDMIQRHYENRIDEDEVMEWVIDHIIGLDTIKDLVKDAKEPDPDAETDDRRW